MYQHHDHAATIKEDDKATCPVMDEPLSKQAAAENDLIRGNISPLNRKGNEHEEFD